MKCNCDFQKSFGEEINLIKRIKDFMICVEYIL